MKTGKNPIYGLFVLVLATIVYETSAISAQADPASRMLEGAKKCALHQAEKSPHR